jgi:hypothetical protein
MYVCLCGTRSVSASTDNCTWQKKIKQIIKLPQQTKGKICIYQTVKSYDSKIQIKLLSYLLSNGTLKRDKNIVLYRDLLPSSLNTKQIISEDSYRRFML